MAVYIQVIAVFSQRAKHKIFKALNGGVLCADGKGLVNLDSAFLKLCGWGCGQKLALFREGLPRQSMYLMINAWDLEWLEEPASKKDGLWEIEWIAY